MPSLYSRLLCIVTLVIYAGPAADSAQLRQLYAQIDQFEQQLAERVAAGYAVVGPMLAAYKDGNAPENFDASWNELRDFRMAIPDGLRELRDEAQRRLGVRVHQSFNGQSMGESGGQSRSASCKSFAKFGVDSRSNGAPQVHRSTFVASAMWPYGRASTAAAF
jgi:hypothetical protein